MLILVGALVGWTICIISFWCGFYLSRLSAFPEILGASSLKPIPIPPFFSSRKPAKKKPKAVSEEEQYRKEQKVAPADPS